MSGCRISWEATGKGAILAQVAGVETMLAVGYAHDDDAFLAIQEITFPANHFQGFFRSPVNAYQGYFSTLG